MAASYYGHVLSDKGLSFNNSENKRRNFMTYSASHHRRMSCLSKQVKDINNKSIIFSVEN